MTSIEYHIARPAMEMGQGFATARTASPDAPPKGSNASRQTASSWDVAATLRRCRRRRRSSVGVEPRPVETACWSAARRRSTLGGRPGEQSVEMGVANPATMGLNCNADQVGHCL
eukprot:CAMPEP_0181489494 /NCGR_PEP_ID=MMETSP1110-20121109/49019_1 /TAXON_ID=174948 /ORGANISM="Symbiodinium sp., Strain CCMP421" /LENGTH=114 /DNA_ID=CAMNT_0023616345 /DNA_START=240 /DNA_END=584 /DNA_ORIENTATION=-